MGRILNSKNIKMAKICVQSPEVVMTGDINLHAQVAVVTKAKLDPFPSRETASATKCHQLWCDQQYWSPTNHTYLSRLAGFACWLLYCTFILATNCFKRLKQNSKTLLHYRQV